VYARKCWNEHLRAPTRVKLPAMDPDKLAPQGPPPEEPLEMGGVVIHPGARIGNYVYIRELGSGGMARVLLAKDPAAQLVALKVLRKSRFKTGLARFRREFRALSKINHPNVIRVEAYGDLYGHPYIAMEYVDGPDLHTLIRSFRGWDDKKRWRRTEEILVELCRALAAIHRRGLVHRDLKPSNVLLSKEGICKLTDFGIVKDLDPSADPAMSTTLVGTWAYASPEQISGNPIDHRSDLYSLGVILFAMLTGKRPFVAKDMAGYLQLHRDRPAPAPREVQADIPAHLDEICRRLLQKAPRDRFQSAQEILYRLEAEERVPRPQIGSEGWHAPLVGRDLEVEKLTNAVAGLTMGRGGLVTLEGEDGSGKSRLLDIAADRARALGIPIYRNEFDPTAPAFSSILKSGQEIAKELGDRMPPELKTALDLFAKADPSGPRADLRYALYDGMREGLLRVLEDRPMLLILDDLHEAQTRDVDLVSYLIRTLVGRDTQSLLVCASIRPKGNPAADALAAGDGLSVDVQTILVGALSREDIATMVFDLVGDSLGARLLAQRLHKETEGNAYFVTEFLRNLLTQGVIAPAPDGDAAAETAHPRYVLTLEPDEIATGHLEIPLGVRQMMKSRLDGVAAADRKTLEVLAVGGREVDLDVLLDVLDADEEQVLDSLDRLLAAGIVKERRAGDAVFHAVTHRKFTDVVYRDLDPERRAQLHRKMAAALEIHYANNPQALEVVGEHYKHAGDAGRAYRYLVAAARRLADRSLMQEAWDLTESAAALEDSASNDLPRADFRGFRRENLDVRANVHYNRGEWAEAEKTWRIVLQLAEEDNDRRAACEVRLHLATTMRRRSHYEECRRYAEAALEESRRLHFREGTATALHCMAALAWAHGNLDECERLANEGLLVAQGSQLAHHRAELLLALTAAQATRGHLAAATSGLTEAEGIFRELRKKRNRCLALANIAELLTWQGEPLQARQRAHVAVQLSTELEYKLGRTVATRAMSVAALDLGLYEEASTGLQDAWQLAQEIETPEETLACLVSLTQLHVERGQPGRARQYAVRGIEVAGQRDPERYLCLLQANLGRALASSPDEGRNVVREAENELAELPVPRRTQVQLALAHAHVALGDRDHARHHARHVLQTAGSRGFRLLSLEARALMTELTEGEEQVQHRAVGLELVRDFLAGLPADMAKAFQRRPFLRYLGLGSTE
jgi:serine/threonine protein kinase/tetratricopeptide (TPR) repeat protein